MYELSPDLTKDYIFSQITQEQIFEKYLGVKVQTKRHFVNPLRNDNRVTCKFKYFGNDLIFTDFSGWFSGNCIKLVMFLQGINYHKALETIKDDFLLTSSSFIEYEPKTLKPKPKERTKFNIKHRNFNKHDAAYWKSYSISSKTLKTFNVKAVKNITIEGSNFRYFYNYGDPAYVYYFDKNEVKIYFPNRKEFRFLSNTTSIQGYNQLPKYDDLLVITKSLKDVMCLYELGIPSVAFQAETVIPSKDIIENFKFRFENVYTFYDFDLTGIRTTNKIKKLYNLPYIFLTNGRFGSFNYGAKDISDYIKMNG
ncbi:MAG: hypothetical protein EOM21_21505, partial [Gammaproteobacteria bacterium]|nr:hypothetical protein [Gammaproteobacteria bacterium]